MIVYKHTIFTRENQKFFDKKEKNAPVCAYFNINLKVLDKWIMTGNPENNLKYHKNHKNNDAGKIKWPSSCPRFHLDFLGKLVVPVLVFTAINNRMNVSPHKSH